MTADDHGDCSTYQRYRCRCDACKAANTAFMRVMRARRYAADIPAHVPHGRASTYTNWGCRCEDCRNAHATYSRERRQR